MKPDDFGIVAEIRSICPNFTGRMLQAARYVTQNPEEVTFHSMREIARRAKVQPVNLVRLAQRLGLSGYGGLRQRFIDEMREWRLRMQSSTTRNEESARVLIKSGNSNASINAFVEEFFLAEHDILRQARRALSEALLENAAIKLAAAPKVYVLARRTAFPAAFALAYALRKARPGVTLLDGLGGTPEGTIDDITDKDVLVAVTFAPFNRPVQTLAKRAWELGAEIIAITDTSAAPIGRFASRFHFVAPTSSRAFPESVLGATAIANLLAALTIAKLGDAAHRRIRQNEQFLVGSGEYLIAAKPARRTRRSKSG